jgi:hypothetical protein
MRHVLGFCRQQKPLVELWLPTWPRWIQFTTPTHYFRINVPINPSSMDSFPTHSRWDIPNVLFHFSYLILRQSVGILGPGISPSQGRYLYKHRINADKSIHTLNGIWTHDPRVRAGEAVNVLDSAVTLIGCSKHWQTLRQLNCVHNRCIIGPV